MKLKGNCSSFAVLSAIVLINTAIDKKNSDELIKQMLSEVSGLETVDETLSMRYLNHFVSVKQEKAQVSVLCCVVKVSILFLSVAEAVI